MSWILTHTAVFLLTVLLVLSPGVIWNALLFRRPTPLADRLLVLLAMGFSIWIAITFALCTTHLLRLPVVGGIAALFLIGALISGRRLITTEWSRPRALDLIVLLPIAAVLGAIYLIALSPSPGIDAGHYHLTIPRLYAEAGGFRRIPFSVQSNWPLNGELLYAVVLLFSDHVSAGLLHFAFGVATSVLLYATCVRISGHLAGAIAVALFWSNPIVQYDGWVANNDLAVTFFFLATLLVTMRAIEDTESRTRWMLVAGVSAGMLAGTKINGVFAVLPVALLILLKRHGTFSAWLRWAVLPAFLIAVVWPLKSWVMTGNPAYPFLFDGPEWSPALTARFQQQMLALGMGRSFVDYLLLPIRIILFSQNDFAHFGGVLNRAWIVIIPLAAWFGRKQSLVRIGLGMAALLFLLWATGSQQIRYLMPAFAPLSLAAGLALAGAFQGGGRVCVALASAIVLLVVSSPAFASAADWTSGYIQEGHRMPQIVIKPVYKFINSRLPKDARILLINNNSTYFIEREVIVDSFFLASQVSDWLSGAATPADVLRMLSEAHVSHLLVSSVPDGTEYPPVVLQFLSERRGLRTAFRDPKNGLELLELCPSLEACPSVSN